MRDPAEILQALYIAGFELQTFELFPRAIGIVRGECIALLVPSDTGLQVLGSPGWKVGESVGVLTTVNGRRVFQSKGEIIEATDERMDLLKRFEADLWREITPRPS
jgi:hypothetical protein